MNWLAKPSPELEKRWTEFSMVTEPDYLTELGANSLARKIILYWKQRGYASIKAWPVKKVVLDAPDHKDSACWIVVSNIGPNGLPPS